MKHITFLFTLAILVSGTVQADQQKTTGSTMSTSPATTDTKARGMDQSTSEKPTQKPADEKSKAKK